MIQIIHLRQDAGHMLACKMDFNTFNLAKDVSVKELRAMNSCILLDFFMNIKDQTETNTFKLMNPASWKTSSMPSKSKIC